MDLRIQQIAVQNLFTRRNGVITIKDIRTMTKEDVLSDEVLCEVFEQEDEIYKARLLATLADHAKSIGAKTAFESLVKAYKKQFKEYSKMQQVQQQTVSGVTEYGDEKYDNMRCGSWIANEYGVKTYTPFGGEVIACYHPILPVQLLVNAETGKEKIKIAYKKRNAWREIIVDKGVIASANKIVQLAEYGISVTSENARNLVKFLNDIENFNTDRIQEQISTSKLGWIKGEFMPYGKNILFDNESLFKDAYESIREEGNREEWYKLVKQIRKTDRFEPKIYLAGALASVLVEPLNALPFIINLWGETGKGKTVAIMLAASVWAYPGGTDYVTDPKSTITAIELRMNFLNNLPMLIDDMAQLKEKYQGDFSELVYFLCSGKGKDRATASMGLRSSTSWKNVILTNGEHSLVTETMQGGAVNRIVDVEMGDGYIFENGNDVVDSLKRNFGFAGRDFISVIEEVGKSEIKKIQQDFLQQIKDAAKDRGIEKEEKQIIPMSIILTADKLATDYLYQDGIYLDFNTCVDLLKNKGEVSENDRAYEFIMSEVAVHINNFKPDMMGQYRGECWGVIEDGYVIIQNNIFNQMCQKGNFSSKAFLSWASKKDLIKGSNGKNSKTKRINGSSGRCVFIRLPEDQDDFVELTQDEQEKLPFM